MIAGDVAAVGVDFGTTNSVVAVVDEQGVVHTRRFETPSGAVDAYRSALLFWREGKAGESVIRHVSGPEALDRALDVSGEHRFLQSLKTHLSSRAFEHTRLFGRRTLLEELIGAFLGDLLPDAAALRGVPIVSGRPVVFAGGAPDDALAEQRLRAAYAQAGLPEITFVYEPVGAAWWYARDLTTTQTVLVADFGGGTSDFSIIRFARERGALRATPLAHAGVGVAGDAFDYRILDAIVAPRLGKGTRFRSFGKLLPIPAHVHATFAQWHRLSVLKAPETLRELRRLQRDAEAPALLEDLVAVIELDLGQALYRSVSALKVALSDEPRATFRFEEAGIVIEREVTRAEFERWISDDVRAIDGAVDEALARAGVQAGAIDAVFMTGGTSQVPVVRALFEARFPPERIHYGDAFRSVASGLALHAAEQADRAS